MVRTLASLVLPLPVVLGIYAVAPVEPQVRWFSASALLTGLLVFVAVMLACLRHVHRSERPVVVALSSIMVTVPVLVAVFAYVYVVLSAHDRVAFTESLSRIDAFYFATSTFATVGFGDIAALSEPARFTVTLQIAMDLVVIGGLLRLYLVVARRRRDERPAP